MSLGTPPAATGQPTRLVTPVPAVGQRQPRSSGALLKPSSGIRLNVRGRSITVRGIRRPATGPLGLLAVLGPGLIAATAGDDAGGIATYSSVGARYGYDLLWMLLLITVFLAVVQEMCARLGAATGRGLLDLVRERFGIGWALFAVLVVLLANGGVIVTEFAGIGAAAELFGISRYLAVPLAAGLLWMMVTNGSYVRVEKVFVAMALVFFAYPVAAVLAGPDWGQVLRGTLVPSIRLERDYILLFVGTVGTTITPYMQLFQQSAVVEKGVARRHYGPERVDAYAGALFSNLIAGFIIVATAATLNVAGKVEVQTAADAAQALKPVAGEAAQSLFAFGLLGASLLAAGVLPLATAYSVSEAFGFRKGVDLDFRRAPMFQRLFSGLLLAGAAIALVPNVPLIPLLVLIQVLNGVMLPVILVFLMLLINDRRLAGSLRNGRVNNIIAWGTLVFVTVAVAVLLGTQAAGLLGVSVFPSGG